jgi:hypothetical protein
VIFITVYIFDADIKYQIHVCHVNLKQNHQAIVVLQSIPGKLRNAKINMALAKLYQQGGMERSAITSYKEVLRVRNDVKVTNRGNLTQLLCFFLFVVYLMTLSVFSLLCDMLMTRAVESELEGVSVELELVKMYQLRPRYKILNRY